MIVRVTKDETENFSKLLYEKSTILKNISFRSLSEILEESFEVRYPVMISKITANSVTAIIITPFLRM